MGRSRRSPALLALACVLCVLTSTSYAESPHDTARQGDTPGEGTVVVRELIPAQAYAEGGVPVTVHGSGFTTALACQFGPAVVPPLAVSNDGTHMMCITPPMATPFGGFVAVGVTIGGTSGKGNGARTSISSPTRGALTFRYNPAPALNRIRPQKLDANGGEIMIITGAHLHTTTVCVFDTHPVAVAETEIISSVLAMCETPSLLPGVWQVSLADDDVDNLRRRRANILTVDGNVPNTSIQSNGINNGGGSGLTVTAYRPGENASPDDFANAETKTPTAEFLANAARSIDETHPSNVPIPTPYTAYPNEGPSQGNAPLWITGGDLRLDDVFCVFRFSGDADANAGRPSVAVTGVAVSSVLAVCERSAVPHWGSVMTGVEMGVPVGGVMDVHGGVISQGIKYSSVGKATFAPWSVSKVTHVKPTSLNSQGGVETSVFGTSFPVSVIGATCRFGVIGPVLGRAFSVDELRCVSPAMAPTPGSGGGVSVYGPDPEASGSFFTSGDALRVRVVETDPVNIGKSAFGTLRAYDARAMEDTTSDDWMTRDSLLTSTAVTAPTKGVALTGAFPTSVPSEFGASVVLTGKGFGLLPVDRYVTCRFGSITVDGLRTGDDSIECFAPSQVPRVVSVTLDGALNAVDIEFTARSYLGEETGTETPASPPPQVISEVKPVSSGDFFPGSHSYVTFVSEYGATNSISENSRCLFDDGASTEARFISPAVASCEVPAVRKMTRVQFIVTKIEGNAQSTAVPTTVPCAPNSASNALCASFTLHARVPKVISAQPKAVPSFGGTVVTVIGTKFPDHTGSGALPTCRFGTTGPVFGVGNGDHSDEVSCVAPGKKPGIEKVTAFDTPNSQATIVFRESFRENAFLFPPAVSRSSYSATVVFVGDTKRHVNSVDVRNARAGPAFDVLELNTLNAHTNVVVEYVDAPVVLAATPGMMADRGGGVVWLVGINFVSQKTMCIFRDSDTGTMATVTSAYVFSSSLAACETSSDFSGKPSDGLDGRMSVVMGGEFDNFNGNVQKGASFSRVTPVVVTDVTPKLADWLESPVVTLALASGKSQSSPIAERSFCWIGVVGPINSRRESLNQVTCVTPAFAGTRIAPVRFLTDISALTEFGSSSSKNSIVFKVNGEKVDPNGRPGGLWAVADSDNNSSGKDSNSASSVSKFKGAVKSVFPKQSGGGLPVVLSGARFSTHDTAPSSNQIQTPRGWCMFEDDTRRVWASAATQISATMVRCQDSPPTPRGASDVDVRLANTNGAARVTTHQAPVVTSVFPNVLPTVGGVDVKVTGVGFLSSDDSNSNLLSSSDEQVNALVCRFGSVGPVAARVVTPSVATCTSPSLKGSQNVLVPVGVATDVSNFLQETAWGGDIGKTMTQYAHDDSTQSGGVFIDGALLSDDTMHAVTLAASGTVSGGVALDLVNVPGGTRLNTFKSQPPRCVFGGDGKTHSVTVDGTWVVTSGESRQNTVSCLSPARLAPIGIGFDAVRVFFADQKKFTENGMLTAQFEFRPVPTVNGLFPDRSWGPEVTRLFGKDLVLGGDCATGKAGGTYGLFAGQDACVFAGGAVPGFVVSSALVACETSAGAHAAKGVKGGLTIPVSGPQSLSLWGADSSASSEGGDSSLWFTTVAPAAPVNCDVQGGWSDGGTLARITTTYANSRKNAPGWLDCQFGSVTVPGRPASASPEASHQGYEFGPLPGGGASDSSYNARRAGDVADLECISPAHAPGVVPLELVPAKSKIPSIGSKVVFAFS